MLNSTNTKKPLSFEQMVKVISVMQNFTKRLPLMFQNNVSKKLFMVNAIKAATYASKANNNQTQIQANLTFRISLNELFSLLNRNLKTLWDFGIGPKLESNYENYETIDELRYLRYYYFYKDLLESLLVYTKNFCTWFILYFFLLYINRYIEYLVNKIQDLQMYLLRYKFKYKAENIFQSFLKNIISALITTLMLSLSIVQMIALSFSHMVKWIENKVNYLVYNIIKALLKLKEIDPLTKYQILTFIFVFLGIIYRVSEERFNRSLLSFIFRRDPSSMGYFSKNSFNY